MNDNSKLAVAALQNGTVIDHIPSHLVFKVVRLLDLENVEGSVTIGYNLDSKKLGKKGILKVSGVTFPEETLNRLALVAPNVNVNIIEDYKVVKKFKVTLPTTLSTLCGAPIPSASPTTSRCARISTSSTRTM